MKNCKRNAWRERGLQIQRSPAPGKRGPAQCQAEDKVAGRGPSALRVLNKCFLTQSTVCAVACILVASSAGTDIHIKKDGPCLQCSQPRQKSEKATLETVHLRNNNHVGLRELWHGGCLPGRKPKARGPGSNGAVCCFQNPLKDAHSHVL